MSRWLSWTPTMAHSPKDEVPKPTNPSSGTFGTGTSGQIQKRNLSPEDIDGAMDHMNAIGARILPGPVLAIPVAAYDAETRGAINVLDMDGLDVALLPELTV